MVQSNDALCWLLFIALLGIYDTPDHNIFNSLLSCNLSEAVAADKAVGDVVIRGIRDSQQSQTDSPSV